MPELQISNELRGDLGEKVFEHFCIQNSFCYISLEQIYNTFHPKGILNFCHGRDRIEVKIPDELVQEIWKFCKPTNSKNNRPYFVFDYLSIPFKDNIRKIKEGQYEMLRNVPSRAFYWIEVKTGNSPLTPNQKNYASEANIKVKLFRIRLENFKSFEIYHQTVPPFDDTTLREEPAEYVGGDDDTLAKDSGKINVVPYTDTEYTDEDL